jgi:hypothetical protein
MQNGYRETNWGYVYPQTDKMSRFPPILDLATLLNFWTPQKLGVPTCPEISVLSIYIFI